MIINIINLIVGKSDGVFPNRYNRQSSHSLSIRVDHDHSSNILCADLFYWQIVEQVHPSQLA